MATRTRHRTGASITGKEEAEQFVAELSATVSSLRKVLEEETEHLAAGRLRMGLMLEARKSELAASYLRGLEQFKAHAITLTRFAPGPLAALKAEHEIMRSTVDMNQTVLATARAVSESLIREFASEMTQRARPGDYGASGRASPTTASRRSVLPLAISVRM